MRNRVFHHEPIWHWQKLPSLHSEIIETIGWINPEMRRFVEMLDRFPETYATGAEFYEQEFLAVFQKLTGRTTVKSEGFYGRELRKH